MQQCGGVGCRERGRPLPFRHSRSELRSRTVPSVSQVRLLGLPVRQRNYEQHPTPVDLKDLRGLSALGVTTLPYSGDHRRRHKLFQDNHSAGWAPVPRRGGRAPRFCSSAPATRHHEILPGAERRRQADPSARLPPTLILLMPDSNGPHRRLESEPAHSAARQR